MDVEWDPAKAAANHVKHNVAFADAIGVFEDPLALSRPDPHPTEERLVILGAISSTAFWSLCGRGGGENIRLLSARRATARERRSYAEDADA